MLRPIKIEIQKFWQSRIQRFRRSLEAAAAAVLVVISFWNIWIFDRAMSDFMPRTSEDVFVRETRYVHIRNALIEARYTGMSIGFITNRDLTSQPRTPDDDQAWAQAQYVMLPWILSRDHQSLSGQAVPDGDSPFVIGDFWDGVPRETPDGLSKVHEFEGLILFRRKPSP